MTAILHRLRVNEISLVDAGANQHAKVLLSKRAPLSKADPTSGDLHADVPVGGSGKPTQCRSCGWQVDGIDQFCKGCGVPFNKATWNAKFINDLPDSSFAVIAPGGKKDADGKTTPRALRYLPYKGADGKVDLPHLRNAMSRLPQSDLSDDLKAKAKAKLDAAAKAAGIGQPAKKAARAVASFVATAVSKGYMDGKAVTLADAIENQEERELLSALWDALYSIFNDDTITEQQEAAMVKASFDQFLTRLQGETPQPSPQPKEARMTLDLTKVAPEVKAHIEKLEADLAEAKKQAPEPEDVLKGLSPEAKAVVEKAVRDADAATAEIRKIREEQARATYIAKARELKHITAKPEEFGPVMKELAEKSPEAFKALETVLSAANEQIAKGALFAQKGTAGDGPAADSAYAEARTAAQELVSKGEAKTIEAGVSLVFKRRPDLYERHRTEQKGRN